MKRLMTACVMLLSLALVSIALAASGPGKFETTLTGKGAKTEHGKLDGTWTVDFANAHAGKVKLTWNGRRAGGGRYVISGSRITLTPKRGGTCKTKGSYRFKRTGNELTFTTIHDRCTARRDVLTYGAWTQVG